MANTDRPRILCVDDDPNVLEGLARTLRGHYVVETANEGTVAIEMLRTAEPFAVIMSDQRMPQMTGTQFLPHARAVAPSSVRVLPTGPEKVMVDRMPTIVEKCLSNIPRMDSVVTILRLAVCQFAHPKQRNGIAIVGELPWGARALKIALDFDSLEAGGNPAEQPMAVMRGREGWYDPQLLEAFAGMRGISQEKTLMLERMVKDVTVGMTFGEDLKSGKGLLLIARGQEVTPALLERMRNFSAELAIREPVRMLLPNPALVAAKEPLPVAKNPAPAISRA